MSSDQNFIEEDSTRGEPITFGSTISLELHTQKNFFLHSEGFILSKLALKSFVEEPKGKINDFNYCNFKIVPFSTSSNFKTQISLKTNLIEKIPEFHGKSKRNYKFLFYFFGFLDLETRRKDITEYKQNLENEFLTNLTLMHKLRGSPVLFFTSIFQLAHAVSYKFLSLNDEDEKNLLLIIFFIIFLKFESCFKALN